MHFDLTDDQKEIKDVARQLLASRSPMAKVREAAEAERYDEALWTELVELAWPGIAVSEEHNGQGLGAVELAVLLEELGYACAATPLLSTATAASVIDACGNDDQRSRWLPGLATGEQTAGIGTPTLVADAEGAAVVVLVDGDDASLVVEPEAEPFQSIDPTRRYATVRGRAEPLGAGAADRVRAAIAAEVAGICQRALDVTVEYVKERKQFGVPVGSFQAVSHRCVQMLMHTESARTAAYYAAWAADADAGRLPEAAALAAAAAAEGAIEVTGSAIQAHGGIGFTWEADLHWLYKRAQLDAALLGGAAQARRTLTRLTAATLEVAR
ncbi:MAG TPA: acyl-CoA dehydrogenase family protein [Solirubrobacteraceae bacterium]|nr:acyl-CoA dehydrogenase family protein [Solirubrobacteraceae bacterium]